MSSFEQVTNVIFDVDGLLLDTEVLYKQISETILAKYGKPKIPNDLRMKMIGRPAVITAKLLVEEMELPISVEECIKLKRKFEVDILPNATLMPGSEKILLHLREHNIPMAVATTSRSTSIKMKFRNHLHLFECFSHVVSGDDPLVKNVKPAPDVFLTAASRFCNKPDPKCCLVFEDAVCGVEGAIAAGMQVVMVPDPILDPESTKAATLVLKSLCDFKPELFCLPPFPT